MMTSFRENAPIRSKLLTVATSMTALVSVPAVAALVRGDMVTAAIGGAAAVTAAALGAWYREAIAHPYVSTVMRMEALAAGDLDSPIEFTNYADCVGRMTKAMFVFRDTARKQLVAQADEQAAVVDLFGDALKALRSGDLTVRITADAPPAYEALKNSYNEAVAAIAELIRSVAESTVEIRTGSSEIAQASEDLARRTESNAASLEETSAAIVQMDERLKATAGAATQTVGRADADRRRGPVVRMRQGRRLRSGGGVFRCRRTKDANLSVVSDTTSRFGTGRSLSSLLLTSGNETGLAGAKVRPDIAATGKALPLARLDTAAAVGAKAVGPGDSRGANAFVDQLRAAVDLGRGRVSGMESYASFVLGQTGLDAAGAKDRLADMEARRSDAVNRRDSYSGVNIDEELASLVTLQNSYSAAARVMSTATQMYDTLIGMVGR